MRKDSYKWFAHYLIMFKKGLMTNEEYFNATDFYVKWKGIDSN